MPQQKVWIMTVEDAHNEGQGTIALFTTKELALQCMEMDVERNFSDGVAIIYEGVDFFSTTAYSNAYSDYTPEMLQEQGVEYEFAYYVYPLDVNEEVVEGVEY